MARDLGKLTLYVAADYRRQPEARALLEAAEATGLYEATCRWATLGEPGEGMGGTVPEDQAAFAVAAAKMDMVDVEAAQVVVQLTTGELCRGGRQVELGLALAQGKRVLVVGPLEHVFHHHPLVAQVSDQEHAVTWLKGYASA